MKRKVQMNNSRQNPPPSYETVRGSESRGREASNYPRPALSVKGDEEFNLITSLDVNLTIRSRVKEFTKKQATILAGQAIYLVAKEGITLQDWMILEWLYSYLLGQKQGPLNLKDPKELELALLLKVILLSGTWIGLEGKTQLPEDILILIRNSRWVPNERTYQSRKSLFNLYKFLEIRIVPVDTLLERSKRTTRYSSYCKGYGEGSSMPRTQRTRPSAEYDGEPVDLDKETLINVPLDKIQQILDLVLTEIKYTNRQRK